LKRLLPIARASPKSPLTLRSLPLIATTLRGLAALV
jgi:hypothetical protein